MYARENKSIMKGNDEKMLKGIVVFTYTNEKRVANTLVVDNFEKFNKKQLVSIAENFIKNEGLKKNIYGIMSAEWNENDSIRKKEGYKPIDIFFEHKIAESLK